MRSDVASKQSSLIHSVGYVRVSTNEQTTEGQSLENQSNRISSYCQSQGWNLIEIFREEGVSGKTINRPKLNQLISGVKTGNIDVILVYKVDRLTRRQKDLW